MITEVPDEPSSTSVVRTFASARAAARAIEALHAAGFSPDAIGVLARNVGEEHQLAQATNARPISAVHSGSVAGRLVGGGGGALIGLATAVLPGVGPLVGVATMVVTGLLGVGAGGVAGGLLGALGAVGVPEHDARRLRERFMHGDVLVVVDAGDRRVEAQLILEQEGRKNG